MRKKTLTSYDIAKYCDIAPRTAVQWISEGRIKAYRTPGNHFRVRIEDFFVFLEKYNMPIPRELTEGRADRKKKILIVDNDKNRALTIERTLKLKEEYKLELAFDGFDAGRKVIEFNPHLVILDIRMSGLDSYAVTERIKAVPELSRTKIIAISSFLEQEGKEKILSSGADVFLDNPLDKEKLLSEISHLLEK